MRQLVDALREGATWRVLLADGSAIGPRDNTPLAVEHVTEARPEGAVTYALEVTNTGEEPAFLAELRPFEADASDPRLARSHILRHGCVSPGDPVAWVALRPDAPRHPEHERFLVEGAGGAQVLSEILAGLALPDGGGVLFAFTTIVDQATRIVFSITTSGEALTISARSMLGHVRLDSGETLRSETFLVAPATDLWRAQVAWANEIAERYGGLSISGSRVGWSDWQYYRREVRQSDVQENLAVLAARDWGVKYLLIDDGYQHSMSDWLEPGERWPGGADAMAARIREAGLSPGLWIAPLTASEHGRLPGQHPDWLVKGADGRPLESRSHMGIVYAIDYSRDEPLEWLRGLVSVLMKDWGVEWVKLDGPILRYYDGARFSDPGMTAVQVIRRALSAVKEAAGDAVVEGEGYYGPSVGMVHTQRVTQDVQTAWPRMRHTTYTNMMSCFLHGRLWTNNPDAFILRDTPSPFCHWDGAEPVLAGDELEHSITALAMTGGVVMLTDRMRGLSPARAALVKSFVPPHDCSAEPVRFAPGEWSPAVWRLRLERDFENWWAIAAFNWTDETVPFELDLPEATGEAGEWHVFDYWQRRYLGLTGRVADGVVRPHGVRLVAARRDTGRPQLVGTDVHITQGCVELASVEWNEKTLALTAVESSPVRSHARLFFHVPGGFELLHGRGSAALVLDGPDPDGILTAAYSAEGAVEMSLSFRRS